MARRSKQEEIEHGWFANWMRAEYPDVIFNSDMSGVKLSKAQAGISKSLRSNIKFPDIVIYKPMPIHIITGHINDCDKNNAKHIDWIVEKRDSGALFIELKQTGFVLHQKRDKTKWVNKHTEEQFNSLWALRQGGYAAEFALGFQQAKRLVKIYMDGLFAIPVYKEPPWSDRYEIIVNKSKLMKSIIHGSKTNRIDNAQGNA